MKRVVNIVGVAIWLVLVYQRFGGALPSIVSDPPPIKVERLSALVVSEQTGDQSLVLQAVPTVMLSEGVECRNLDDDLTDLTSEPGWAQAAFKRPRASLPWIVVLSPDDWFEGPLPATVDELRTLVREHKP